MLAALETTTRPGSVALLDLLAPDDIAEVFLPEDLEVSASLMPALESLLVQKGLTPKDLTAVAVAVGPGSFTGIRVGLATAQGLALPDGLPCLGVSTLESLAENLRAGGWEGEALCLVDAQRGELFTGHYAVESGRIREISPPAIRKPAELSDAVKGRVWLVGPAVLKYERELRDALGARGLFAFTDLHRARASSVARLAFRRLAAGEKSYADALKPLYLRPPAAEEGGAAPPTAP